MDTAHVVLLVFLLLAAATVVISILLQQYLSNRTTDVRGPSQLDRLGEQPRYREDHPPEPRADRRDRSPATTEERLREASAEELEAVADRERQYAEQAEAEARRLRESDDDTAGPPPTEQQARRRRAGIAPEDLDF